MVNSILNYYKGRTRGNITLTNLINDGKFTAYDASWADTTNTTVVISEESAPTVATLTVSGSDVVSVGTTTIVIKASSLSSLSAGKYIMKILPSDGTDTDEGRCELRVIE